MASQITATQTFNFCAFEKQRYSNILCTLIFSMSMLDSEITEATESIVNLKDFLFRSSQQFCMHTTHIQIQHFNIYKE